MSSRAKSPEMKFSSDQIAHNYERCLTSLARIRLSAQHRQVYPSHEIKERLSSLFWGDLINLAISSRRLMELCRYKSKSGKFRIIVSQFEQIDLRWTVTSKSDSVGMPTFVNNLIHSSSITFVNNTLEIDPVARNIEFVKLYQILVRMNDPVYAEKFTLEPRIIVKDNTSLMIYRVIDIYLTAEEWLTSLTEHCAENEIYLEKMYRP